MLQQLSSIGLAVYAGFPYQHLDVQPITVYFDCLDACLNLRCTTPLQHELQLATLSLFRGFLTQLCRQWMQLDNNILELAPTRIQQYVSQFVPILCRLAAASCTTTSFTIKFKYVIMRNLVQLLQFKYTISKNQPEYMHMIDAAMTQVAAAYVRHTANVKPALRATVNPLMRRFAKFRTLQPSVCMHVKYLSCAFADHGIFNQTLTIRVIQHIHTAADQIVRDHLTYTSYLVLLSLCELLHYTPKLQSGTICSNIKQVIEDIGSVKALVSRSSLLPLIQRINAVNVLHRAVHKLRQRYPVAVRRALASI